MIRMTNKQALGYMLLACKDLKLDKDQADKLWNAMFQNMDEFTEEEAQENGHEWLNSY